MSIISEVKCARCDRKYSGVRSRCPYCGARRISSGKYSEDGENSRGKMIIGVLIMAVLVVAAAVLLFTAPQEPESIESPVITDTGPSLVPEVIPNDTGTTGVEGLGPIVTPPTTSEDEQSESPSPVPLTVESVTITYTGNERTDFTGTIGEQIPLRVRVEPAGIELDEVVVWESSNTNVFEVVSNSTDGTSALVTIIGSGTAKDAILTASVGGKKAECIVRVKR